VKNELMAGAKVRIVRGQNSEEDNTAFAGDRFPEGAEGVVIYTADLAPDDPFPVYVRLDGPNHHYFAHDELEVVK
jgi:hypothetical protein